MRPSRLSRPSRNCPHQRSQSRKRLGRCRSVGSLAESPLAPSTVSISQAVVQVFLAEREERRVRPAGRVGCRPLRSPVRPRSVADLAPGLHVCFDEFGDHAPPPPSTSSRTKLFCWAVYSVLPLGWAGGASPLSASARSMSPGVRPSPSMGMSSTP